MADRLKEIPQKILAWWNRFTTKQKSMIVGAAAVVIFAFAIIVYVISRPQYVTLVTCETTAEASEVTAALESAGISYQASNDGLRIQVESADQSTAALALGSAGITADGISLSDYMSTSMSTTTSDRERYYTSYLEDYIADTIKSQNAINDCTVHLNIPSDNGTIASQNLESSAWIQIDHDGTYTSTDAAALAKSIATWLRNENTANITIMDTNSNLLFSGGDDYTTAGVASSMQELRNQAESMLANQVKQVLLGTNQYTNAVVTSHLDMDYSNYEKTVKEYYANDGRDEGMISHEETYESESSSGGGGVPGTDSNGESGNSTYVYQDSDTTSSSSSETSRDYLPNESLENSVTPAGGIDYSTSSISIAAISYREIKEDDIESQGLLDGTTWEEYKLANSADVELTVSDSMYSLVANATGISQDNITIVAYESPLFIDSEDSGIDLQTILSIVLLVLILGLLAFVILGSMRGRKDEQPEEELSVESLLQSTPESELEDIDVESKSETRKMIEKFVDENPESAAALLRNWLNEDWD